MQAKDGSTVWIPRNLVPQWQAAQKDNSPEKQRRIAERTQRLYQLMSQPLKGPLVK